MNEENKNGTPIENAQDQVQNQSQQPQEFAPPEPPPQQQQTTAAPEQNAQREAQPQYAQSMPYPPEQKAKKDHKLLIIIGAVCVVIAAFLTMMLFGGKSIDMQDYVTVSFNGVDGKGTAYVDVDYDSMGTKLLTSAQKRKLETGNGWGSINTAVGALGQQWVLAEALDCELDQSSELSNGDKVTVTVTADKDVLKQLGVKVKHKKLTFKVEGLVEVSNIDAFADISVQFSGISPQGEAEIINNSSDDACMQFDYSLDQNSGLSNGDTVTVTISDYDLEGIAERTGKTPEEMSKSFTVEGLQEYVTKLDQINDTARKSMQKEAEDYIRAYSARYYSSECSLTSLEYVGSYLRVAKPGANTNGDANRYALVYKLNCRVDRDGITDHPYYYYVTFANLALQSDGSIDVDLTDMRTTSESHYFDANGHNYYVYGFENLQGVFDEIITQMLDIFTYETDIQ